MPVGDEVLWKAPFPFKFFQRKTHIAFCSINSHREESTFLLTHSELNKGTVWYLE